MYVCACKCINKSNNTAITHLRDFGFLTPSGIGLRCKGKKCILLTIRLLYAKTRPFQVGNSRVKTGAKAYL